MKSIFLSKLGSFFLHVNNRRKRFTLANFFYGSPLKMAIAVNSIAQTLLPTFLYRRLTSSDIAKRLTKGSLWSMFGSATSRLMVLISMILIARVLGKVSFGEFGLIQSTLGVAGIMAGVGLGSTATRFVAQYAAADRERAGRTIGLVQQTAWISILLASILLIFASSFLSGRLLHAPHLETALNWGALLMAANVLRGIQSGIMSALERFDVVAKLNILEGVLSLTAMLVLAMNFGVSGALLGMAVASITVWIIGRVKLNRLLMVCGIEVNKKNCWQEKRILHSFALPSLISTLVATPVLWFCMTVLAGSANGYAELGLYHAAYQWHGPMIFIPMILMSVSMPILVQEWENGQRERFRKITLWVCGFTLFCILPPVLLITGFSPWVMSFYGPDFIDGWRVLVLILVATPFHALAKIGFCVLFSMNRAWWVVCVNLMWGAILLILTEWLVPNLGALGLAIGFSVAYGMLGIISLLLVNFGSCLVDEGKINTENA
ncbi:MAG: oligosaccharide flippase family protein [Gammaproteobacteria bacterium]